MGKNLSKDLKDATRMALEAIHLVGILGGILLFPRYFDFSPRILSFPLGFSLFQRYFAFSLGILTFSSVFSISPQNFDFSLRFFTFSSVF